MVDSIHVARWIAQFDPTEVKFYLFPSGPNRRVHPKILEMIKRGEAFDSQISIVPFGGKFSLPLWAADRLFSDRIRGWLLRRVLRVVGPDFVHALEFQNAGYVTIRALDDVAIKTPFIATNYGSDIYWFSRFPSHVERIKRILSRAQMYSAECKRDVELAIDFGFRGKVLPIFPNAGGFEPRSSASSFVPPSQRKVIAVKGYQGWAGRALVVMDALETLRGNLDDFKVIVFSASTKVIKKAEVLSKKYGLNIVTHKNGALSHEQVAQILDSARLYIGVSRTDGISTSLLEAMRSGAFPIQSRSSCASEWIRNGESGHLLDGLDVNEISGALAAALAEDRLVDTSSEINIKTISQRASIGEIALLARRFYSLS
jgi:glycosyltransferase involved in cell wall biosynthesis